MHFFLERISYFRRYQRIEHSHYCTYMVQCVKWYKLTSKLYSILKQYFSLKHYCWNSPDDTGYTDGFSSSGILTAFLYCCIQINYLLLNPEQVAEFVGRSLFDRFHFASSKSYFPYFSQIQVHADAVYRPVSIPEYAVPNRDDTQRYVFHFLLSIFPLYWLRPAISVYDDISAVSPNLVPSLSLLALAIFGVRCIFEAYITIFYYDDAPFRVAGSNIFMMLSWITALVASIIGLYRIWKSGKFERVKFRFQKLIPVLSFVISAVASIVINSIFRATTWLAVNEEILVGYAFIQLVYTVFMTGRSAANLSASYSFWKAWYCVSVTRAHGSFGCGVEDGGLDPQGSICEIYFAWTTVGQ